MQRSTYSSPQQQQQQQHGQPTLPVQGGYPPPYANAFEYDAMLAGAPTPAPLYGADAPMLVMMPQQPQPGFSVQVVGVPPAQPQSRPKKSKKARGPTGDGAPADGQQAQRSPTHRANHNVVPRVDEHQAYACVAERYKTKFCKSFMTAGHCPYESKCMFAHGGAELRTKEMNVHDGITSETAVKAFRKLQTQLRRHAAQAMRAAEAVAAAAAHEEQQRQAQLASTYASSGDDDAFGAESPLPLVSQMPAPPAMAAGVAAPAVLMERPVFQSVLAGSATGTEGDSSPFNGSASAASASRSGVAKLRYSHNPYSWDESVVSHSSSALVEADDAAKRDEEETDEEEDAFGGGAEAAPADSSTVAQLQRALDRRP